MPIFAREEKLTGRNESVVFVRSASTIGQADAGSMSGGGYTLNGGFWGGVAANYNIYLPTTASGEPIVGTAGSSDGLGTIQQGMLEQSNVNVVDEFVAMILAQRSYESNSRVIKAADEMLQQLNQLAQ